MHSYPQYEELIKLIPSIRNSDLFELSQHFEIKEILLLASLEYMSIKLKLINSTEYKNASTRIKFKKIFQEVKNKKILGFNSSRFLIIYAIDWHNENFFGVTKEIYYPDGRIDDTKKWRFTNHFIARIIERNNEGKKYYLHDMIHEVLNIFKGSIVSRILSAHLNLDKFFAFSNHGGIIATMDEPSTVITYLNIESFSKKWHNANEFQIEANKIFGQALGFYEAGLNKEFFTGKLEKVSSIYREIYFELIN